MNLTGVIGTAVGAFPLEGGEGGGFKTPTPEIFWLPLIGDGKWAITEQMVWGTVSVVILLALFGWMSAGASAVPSKKQFLFEGFYNFARNDIARDMIGTKHFMRFVPLLFSLFSLILLNNWFGIFALVMNPTMGKIGFPIALTVVVYVVYHWIGIEKHGVKGYFAHLVPEGLPGPIKGPIWLLEFMTYFITRPLTLALRLFGNMFAGHMLIALFVGAAAYFLSQGWVYQLLSIPTFLMAGAMWFFEGLVQALQAYVFTLLAASYIAGAVADDH